MRCTWLPIVRLMLLTGLIVTSHGLVNGKSSEGFTDSFEELATGQKLIDQDPLYLSFPDKVDSPVVVAVTDAQGQAAKAIEHRGETRDFLVRTQPGSLHALTGQVRASLDVQIVSGRQLILIYDQLSPAVTAPAQIVIEDMGADRPNAIVRAIGQPTHNNVAELPVGKDRWYRLVITMRLDPQDGSKSRYDLQVIDLADQRTLGAAKDIGCPGQPTHARGLQI